MLGKVRGSGTSLRNPAFPRPVEQPHVVLPVVLQVPVRVRREPVLAVAVQDDLVLVRDATTAEQLAEGLRTEEIPLDLILEVLAPIETDRAREVGLAIERRVLIDLD